MRVIGYIRNILIETTVSWLHLTGIFISTPNITLIKTRHGFVTKHFGVIVSDEETRSFIRESLYNVSIIKTVSLLAIFLDVNQFL